MARTNDLSHSGRSAAADSAADGPLNDPAVLAALQQYDAELRAGRTPDRQALLDRFPAQAAELAECLDGLHFVGGAAAVMPPADPVHAGHALGDFRIVREVGRGGMGVVYEAVQLSLGRRVALKVLPSAAAVDSRHLERFKTEAQAAAALHHPTIVPVFAVGCDRGVHYYAMQFIDGRTLAAVIGELRDGAGPASGDDRVPAPRTESWLRNDGADGTGPTQPCANPSGRRPAAGRTTSGDRTTVAAPAAGREFFRYAADLGARVADALAHAHRVGVIHRDVKPANLIVDTSGAPWVTDFGLARLHEDGGLTATGDVLGTLRYMSPEQATGRPLDHRTDVYSLGVTLYELLTLRPAFPDRDRAAVLRRVVSEEPVPPRRLNLAVPADLETVVLKAMAKSPADRYPTADAHYAHYAHELATVYHNAGDLAALRGRQADAVAAVREAIRRREPLAARPGAPAAYRRVLAHDHHDLGCLLRTAGRWADADAAFRRALELHPDAALILAERARLLADCPDAAVRQPGLAVDLARAAVDRAPNVGAYWQALGVAQYRAGDWPAAAAALEKAVDLGGGGTAEDWLFLSMAHARRGDAAAAKSWYGKAAGWMAGQAPADRALTRLRAEAAALVAEAPLAHAEGAGADIR